MAKIQDIDIPYLEFAEGAAPGTPASAISRIYVKSDGLFYSKDDAGVETPLGGSGGTTPTAGRVVLSAGNYTGTTGSFGDVTGATVTITTTARRVLVGVVCAAQLATGGDAVCLDIDIDGARQGGTNGLTGSRGTPTAGYRQNLSFTYLTAVLSAASHTFKLQAKRTVGSGTVTIFADSADLVLELWVSEQGATA